MIFINPKHRRILYTVIIVALLVVVVGMYQNNSEMNSLAYHEDIETFFDDLYVKLVSRSPETINSHGLAVEDYGIPYQNYELRDLSKEYSQESLEIYKEALDIIQKYEDSSLTTAQAVQKNSLQWSLEHAIEKERFMDHDYLIHPQGDHAWVIEFLTRYHPMEKLQDAEDYIERLAKVEGQIHQLMKNIEDQETEGIRPPFRIINGVETQVEQLTSIAAADEHPLYHVFQAKLKEIENASNEEKEALKKEAKEIINQEIMPVYEELLALIEEIKMQELRSPIRDSIGVWELPAGDDYYQWQLKENTSTDMTPEEIHELGLAKVEKTMVEMREIFDELGYEDQSHQEVLRGLMRIEPLADEDKLLEHFHTLKERGEGIIKEILAPELQSISELQIKIVPQYSIVRPYNYYYEQPRADGSEAGTFYINNQIPQLEWAIETVGFHEGIPGHHLQYAIEAQQEDLHDISQLFRYRGYAEGWATYGEHLAGEFDLFSDHYGELGYLRMRLLQAGSSVVDTGIHHYQWSRKEAVDYLSELMGADMTSPVDSIIMNPGFVTAYLVGEEKIKDLKERAESEMGDGFDLKAFHTVILENGRMPLEVLEMEVERFMGQH